MKTANKKIDRVDSLIDHLWQHGYLTLSRKYGKYLPAPTPIGNYEVDAVAKYKKKIALGLTLTAEDLDDPNLITKLIALSNSKLKLSASKVTLFIGVPNELLIKAHLILSSLDDAISSQIKIVTLPGGKSLS
ncbi:MAG: hypothetical protein FJ214_02570 [Ignavibacteria bacterium]|nr:hypothetical protein [Ignavibacteria bacterium]